MLDYIVSLTAVRAQDAQPPPPWERIPVDLNKGAKGDYIWLYRLRGHINSAITSLHVLIGGGQPFPGFIRIPLDLNAGAGGNYVYLCYSRLPGLGPPIKNVHVVAAKSDAGALVPPGYQLLPGDLNSGAGGDYIYVIYSR